MSKSKWIAFKDRVPALVVALDDPNVTVTPRVLVTNNINGCDRMGRPSHVWYLSPMIASQKGRYHNVGDLIGFDEADRVIANLTHWLDPFADDEEVQSD